MFKRISIFLMVLLIVLCFVGSASAVDPGLFIEKDADNTYIDYVDAAGTSIMKIDHLTGVTIAVEVVGSTYSSMTVTATTDATSIDTGSITTAGGASIADQLWLGDDIDMTTNTTGLYDITLKTHQADALSIVDDAPGDLMVFCTTTGSQSITITPATTITGLLTSNGGITVGASDDGFDVTFYGENAGSDFVWDQNGATNTGMLSLGANTDGVDFKVFATTTGNYLLWDHSTDDLLLVGTDTQLHIAGTTASTNATSGSLKTAGGLGVAGAAFIAGAVEIGVDGTGTDFTVYGDTTLYEVMWDASGDINGAWLFGTDTKGVMVTMYGATTNSGIFWDPNADTNGTLTIGVDATGHDVTMFGDTTGLYWKWDQSADKVTQTASIAIAPIAAGTFIDFQLDTEWVSGTLIDADFGAGTTFSNDVIGMELDFSGNITMTTNKDVTGHVVKLPALTQSAANTTAITGFNVHTAGALVQDTEAAGVINWTGVNVQMPNQTQTAGTVTCIGLNILSGTYTSGTELAILTGADTAGLDVKFFANTTGNYLLWDESADDLLLVGTATTLQIAGTTDTSLTTNSIVTAGGIACTKQLWLGDDLDMSANGTGVYDFTLKDNVADALSIVRGATDMMVFTSTSATPKITITPEVLFLDDIDLSTSGTDVYDLTLKTDTADALSITDGTDIVVFNTTSGTPVVTITPITTITGVLTSSGGIVLADDVYVAFGTGSDVTMEWDNTRATLATAPAGFYVSPEGMSDRFRLTWVAGERGKPGINGDITNATEATRMVADPHFEILGTSGSSDDVTYYAEGGIDLETDGTDGNGVILLPHLDANQTAWTQVTWGTDKEVRWECTIKTGAAITTSIIWAGLKLTNTDVVITDANQVFFRYEDGVNDGEWQAVNSIADSDDAHDTNVVVAINTVYHLVIEINSSRVAKFYINGALVETSAALTDAIDLIPYIAIEEDGASSAMTLYVRGQAISRAY